MHRYVTRACVAAAAGLALTAAGVTVASASGSAPRAPQAIRLSSAATSRAAVSPGAQLWVKRYNGPGSGTDDASSVAVSPSGNSVFVTGRSQGAKGNYEYATVAYNADTGARLWVKNYNGLGGNNVGASVAVSPSGKTVFVTGQSLDTRGGSDYATVAYNAVTGAQLWVKRYGTSLGYASEAVTVAASPNGKTVFVTGTSFGAAGGDDYATIAYNAATGSQRWVKRYNGLGNGANYAHSLAVSATGSTVFATGYSLGTNNGYDYATVAYNAATGAQRWVKRYNSAAGGNRGANSVAVSPSGTMVFVTGSSLGSSGRYDYATVAYSAATGAQRWVKRYHGTASEDDEAYSVAVSPSGKAVFVTGSSEGTRAGTYEYATVAYNAATGAQLWVKRYSSPGNVGEGYSVAVSPNGSRVYVTGSSWKFVDGDLELATVAYSAATGAQLWAKRYGSPGGGGAGVSVAVSRTAGTVFVTGYSIWAVAGFDYVTIAYKG